MRMGWKALIGGMLAAMPGGLLAQTPFNTSGAQASAVNVGGTPTIDLITVRAEIPSFPLRNGAVIAGSERVQLDGRSLVRGVDYQIDLAAGVVYLMRVPHPGQAITVSYRYEPAKAKVGGQQFAGLGAFKFDLAPGGYGIGKMIAGFGLTERRADGSVLTSNVYGWNNALDIGGVKMNGLMMLGQKKQVDSRSAYEFENPGTPGDLGNSRFMVQSLGADVMGGKVEASYQDISKNFSGFGAAQDTGFDAAALSQFQKERGLKRFSLGVKNLDFGGLKFTNGVRQIQDTDGDIEWKDLGFAAGGLSMNWSSRHVDQGFKRFNDIAEKEREQLKREAGMTRDTFSAAFASKTAKMSLNVAELTDPQNKGIKKSEFQIDAQKYRFTFGEQSVAKDFTRMGSLLDQEKAMYGRELGLNRQWTSLEASLIKGAGPIKFSQSILRMGENQFKSEDIEMSVNGWSLQHVGRQASGGFNSFGAMQDAERNGNIQAITKMYDPKGFGPSGRDVSLFSQGSGLGRSLTRISGAPFKGWNASFESLKLTGAQDGGEMNSMSLSGKGFDAHYKGISLGDKFTDVSRLMDFERARIGSVPGLEQEDFGLNLAMGKGRLSLGMFNAETLAGGASRQTLAYQSKDINASVNVRKVDPAMADVNQLADPEKDLLAALKGFKERDIKASWQINPKLKLDFFDFSADSDALDQQKRITSQRLAWNPDKYTQIGAVRIEQNNDDPLKVLFASVTEQMQIYKDLGKFGKLRYMTLTRDYDGTMSTLPDSEKRYFSYETRLDPKTVIKTEQTETKFEDGAHENIRANSVSTEITNRTGVSVTDVQVDRKGVDHDESNRNYGFWYDFGNGIRVSVGRARNLNNGQAAPTAPGMIGATEASLAQMAGGATPEALWAEMDNETNTYQVSTAKPLKFAMLSDMQFKAGYDSARDRSRWIKENRNFNWSAKLWGTALAYEFKGQMAPNGKRATDRSFNITTDQSDTSSLKASIFYKLRKLPDGDPIVIRNFSVAAKPAKNIEVTHQLMTNPEVARGDAILGSVTQASRLNRWKLDVKQNKDLTVGGSWEEIMDRNKPLARVGGINIVLNQSSGSPLKLFYGVEEADRSGKRYSTYRYHLQFDQKPGPNQLFSIFMGNVSYQHTLLNGQKRDNWTLRVDYQIKF